MTAIRKSAPVHLIVHHPQTQEGKEELSRRVADIHAASVNQRLKALNCPAKQKLELLDAVIETVMENRGQE